MINRIISPRVAAVALAASALIAAPAFADPVAKAGATLYHGSNHSASNSSFGLTIRVGDNGHYRTDYHRRSNGYGHSRRNVNEFGQTRREVRQLKSNAVRACRRAVARTAYNIGFRDVDFDRDDTRARQIGPNGFRVRLNDTEFETRRRDIDRDVTCIVRRGQVRDIQGLPQRGNRGVSRTGYGNDRVVERRRGNGYGNRY